MKESFILHTKQYTAIKLLTLEQKGRLLDAIYLFQMGEDVDMSDDPMLMMAFAFIKASLIADNKKYDEIVKKRSEAGKKHKGNQYTSKVEQTEQVEQVFQNGTNGTNGTDMIYKESKDSMYISNNLKNELSKDNSQKDLKNAEILDNIRTRWNNLIDKYHSTMPKIKGISANRKKFILARHREYGLMGVYNVMELAVKNDFLNGSSSKGWIANFDWVMNQSNFIKILEGNYDNKNATKNNNENGTNQQTSNDKRRATEVNDTSTERFATSF
jgi:hypothetical protein